MKKLILVALLLVAVLLLSWWAKGANFSLVSMMQNVAHSPTATQSGTIIQTNRTGPSPTAIPIEIIITVTPNGFVPDVIMIAPNTKITWVNKSGITANISSDPKDAFAQLNLGDFGQNASVSLVFPSAGRFHYLNGANPSQKGILVVK